MGDGKMRYPSLSLGVAAFLIRNKFEILKGYARRQIPAPEKKARERESGEEVIERPEPGEDLHQTICEEHNAQDSPRSDEAYDLRFRCDDSGY